MKLIVDEGDYEEVLGEGEVAVRFRHRGEHLAEDAGIEHEVFDHLPRVLAEKFRRMVPNKFALQNIDMEFDVSGKPFGIGIGGKIKVSFRPE